MEKFYRRVPLLDVRAMKDDDDEDDDKDYIRPAQISSTAVDEHRTRMDLETTLKNFVTEANAGVPTMDTHNRKLGVGITSDAQLEDSIVIANLSVVRGVPLGAEASYPHTDALIRMIEKNVVKAVSVGAYGGIHRCNVCGNDMWRSWDCYHWPGVTYIIEDENSDKKREVECIPVIEDAHLGEVSFVPIGSNRDAKIIDRAARHAEEGRLSSKQIVHINRMFGSGLDLRSANDTNIPIIGGFDSMDLKEAQAEIQRLEGENKTLKTDKQKLERSNEELKGAKVELDKAQGDLRQETIDLYKEYRGNKITGAQLTAYEKRLDSFDLENLKIEHEQMSGLASKAEPPEVESGQRTVQDDKTKANPSGDAEAAMSRGLPPWAVK